MKILREVTAQEVVAALPGRAGRAARDLVLGRRCRHRKWGETYDTYATINSYWILDVLGRNRYVSFFGFLASCDMCGWRGIRWPGWEPSKDY